MSHLLGYLRDGMAVYENSDRVLLDALRLERQQDAADAELAAEKPSWLGQMEDWIDGLEPADQGGEGGALPGLPPAPPSDDTEAVPRLWRAADLKPAVQPRWLAKGRLQRGAVNLLVGDEGLGKSLLWVWIAAAVSTGRAVPEFGIPVRDRGHVIIAAITEDDWCSTVCPRLEVAGADLSTISVVCT